MALPKLLGDKTAERVRYVMTDGDSHEFMELDKAIIKYFPNATRGRCGWHIITKKVGNDMVFVTKLYRQVVAMC